MTDRQDNGEWQKFTEAVFKAADLPEVTEDQLEPGTYTNAQIAEKLRDDPIKFMGLMMDVSNMGNQVQKRSLLSFIVDMIVSKE